MSAKRLLAPLAIVLSVPLGAQIPMSGTFVSTLGTDTVAVE
ncbi:MAG: hypothetical protein ABIQ55_04160 [Gemmatimonadaceae bacterium]